MEKGTVIIGIDPDNQESGVGAVYDEKKFLAYKMNFPALIDYLRAMNESCKKIKVVIEGGWQIMGLSVGRFSNRRWTE